MIIYNLNMSSVVSGDDEEEVDVEVEVEVQEQGLTSSARCNQCVSGRRSQSAENFLFWFLWKGRSTHLTLS